MRVHATHESLPAAVPATTAGSTGSAGFQAALAAAQESQSSKTTAATPAQGETSVAASGKKTALEQLEEYLRKTPAEHMREAILKQMGLTEADLAAMSPEQRTAVENTIAEKIREFMLGRESHLPSEEQASLSIQSLLAVG
ncbi:hypothetical protein [Rhodocyclus tenuis]|uniref:hypothetical protein n=1 Tax=Rhodocyclus tenuis TaxID=1066 RepID=UPI001904BF63|nr:hypothetical protein [Rhodocyclus tenuis]